jgi:hypothetical protein
LFLKNLINAFFSFKKITSPVFFAEIEKINYDFFQKKKIKRRRVFGFSLLKKSYLIGSKE